MTEKKKYEMPQSKAYQVKPASIICQSTEETQVIETYDEVDTQEGQNAWTWK